MADIDRIIPFIIRYEAGVGKTLTESLPKYFDRAKKHNYNVTDGTFKVNGDKGGLTVVGITSQTFEYYCKKKGKFESKGDCDKKLLRIDFATWKDVLKTLYWNPWKADEIKNQSLALMVVDFGWMSGISTAIKKVQKSLGLEDDGVVGPITLAKLNEKGDYNFIVVQRARLHYIARICANNPSQGKFLNGWVRRIDAINYED